MMTQDIDRIAHCVYLFATTHIRKNTHTHIVQFNSRFQGK